MDIKKLTLILVFLFRATEQKSCAQTKFTLGVYGEISKPFVFDRPIEFIGDYEYWQTSKKHTGNVGYSSGLTLDIEMGKKTSLCSGLSLGIAYQSLEYNTDLLYEASHGGTIEDIEKIRLGISICRSLQISDF